jgi:hypothetical protein
VVFFGRRQLKPSLNYMAAFWLSVAGARSSGDGPDADAALRVH